jgi:hypothetical protein
LQPGRPEGRPYPQLPEPRPYPAPHQRCRHWRRSPIGGYRANGRTALAQDVDGAIVAADRIADRRDTESDRLARHAEIARRLDEANKALQALAAEESELTNRRTAHDENWQVLWNVSGVKPGAPAEMVNWLNLVATLIGDRDALDADAAKLDALLMREEALRPAVEALGAELGMRIQGLPLALADATLLVYHYLSVT